MGAGVIGFVNEPDFWDSVNKIPLRIIIVEMDNAPYNHGAACQVNSLTKGRCADILRDVLKVPFITFDHVNKDGSVIKDIRAEVPASKQKWEKQGDLPSADDVRKGLVNAIRNHPTKSHLLEPPYKLVCAMFGMEVTHTAPYTSIICPIEFKWQDGKGWAANPRNQKMGRSCAEVVALLREKWFMKILNAEEVLQDPVHPNVWINHCHNVINDKIEEYAKLNAEDAGVSLLRGTIFNLSGLPSSSELIEWKEKAGMGKAIMPDENDMELDGDVNYIPDIDDDVDANIEEVNDDSD